MLTMLELKETGRRKARSAWAIARSTQSEPAPGLELEDLEAWATESDHRVINHAYRNELQVLEALEVLPGCLNRAQHGDPRPCEPRRADGWCLWCERPIGRRP